MIKEGKKDPGVVPGRCQSQTGLNGGARTEEQNLEAESLGLSGSPKTSTSPHLYWTRQGRFQFRGAKSLWKSEKRRASSGNNGGERRGNEGKRMGKDGKAKKVRRMVDRTGVVSEVVGTSRCVKDVFKIKKALTDEAPIKPKKRS